MVDVGAGVEVVAAAAVFRFRSFLFLFSSLFVFVFSLAALPQQREGGEEERKEGDAVIPLAKLIPTPKRVKRQKSYQRNFNTRCSKEQRYKFTNFIHA